jgi:sterol desaturase/sphingolipid hydroxylase (fatty acid hydroxylase superfamily)
VSLRVHPVEIILNTVAALIAVAVFVAASHAWMPGVWVGTFLLLMVCLVMAHIDERTKS